ncbi:bifunctional lytic transglycosylase/C40 family peptidase (plasmid) [Streptomyces niveus]|uniref:C40 family peptidase n=1 Tax=Streptomyces niveus TaxID=193462 RepID=UPI002E37CB0F|nr:bifunctional lytic transglycosylase/C40 family peptidase [Streptomyces niveus]
MTAAVVAVPVAVIGTALMAAGADVSAPDLGPTAGLNTAAMPAAGRKWADWYVRSAAQCPQLSPALLAAQGYQESGFRTDIESEAGATGIAQFLPTTYATWGQDSDGDGVTGPNDPEDAIMAQGKFMCSMIKRAETSGYPGTPVELALAGYNAGWGRVQEYGGVPPESFAAGQTYHYVRIITATAKRWSVAAAGISGLGSGSGPDAVRRAYTQLGIPYSWGGGSPEGPTTGFCDGQNGYLNGSCSASRTEGFDCSSLVQYAWWPSLKLPRTAADQYRATASRPVSRNALAPGDLLFWSRGGTAAIYHVAIYLGDGSIVHTPRTGKSVTAVDIDAAMPTEHYVGATRPGA